MRKITADYHLHSNISPDSRCPMEQICQSAIQKGFQEIALTDHYEIYTPGYEPELHGQNLFDSEYLIKYHEELELCREKFQGQLMIKQGIEIGQPHVNQLESDKVMNHLSFDYVIGSVHKLNNIDLGQEQYPQIDVPKKVRENLESLYRLADECDFDCIGHLDLVKRYAAQQGVSVRLEDYPEELTAVLTRIIQRGKGIELNTSGIRQATGEALPSVSVLKLYKKLGGEIITVGSDAHKGSDVGMDFSAAAEMLAEAGFTYVTLYENRCPSFYKFG